MPPEEPGTPPRLSGAFYNATGEKIIEIDRNEWVLPTAIADCEIHGRTLSISSVANQIALQIEMHPPNRISINSLNMFKDGTVIRTLEGCIGVFLCNRDHEGPGIAVSFDCWHPSTCVIVDAGKVDRPFRALKIVGGEGITLEGPDIQLGAGNGKAEIRRIALWPKA